MNAMQCLKAKERLGRDIFFSPTFVKWEKWNFDRTFNTNISLTVYGIKFVCLE